MNDWYELKTILKALAGVARMTIVYYLLRQQEITVTDLTDLLGISQPLVSWHLRKLRRAGVISTRRVGRQVYCSLNADRIRLCIQGLESLLDPAFSPASLPSGEALMEAEVGLEE
jgi:ArsR family transcriptional regulator